MPCLVSPRWLLLLSLLPGLLWCSGAQAITRTVTTLADHDDGLCDAGDCTLREAINTVNATPGADTILFKAGLGGTIQLSAALPDLGNITMQGPGAGVLTVRRNTGGNYRIFTVPSGSTASISGLTISNGLADGAGNYIAGSGGGIYNDGGTLTVQNCTITGNAASGGGGGGVANRAGTLTVQNCTINGNSARDGGGIYSSRDLVLATLTVQNSTISGNSVISGIGGGIHSYGSTTTVQNCTISGNSAPVTVAGGIYSNGMLTVQNSTISGNSSYYDGGGIDCLSGPTTVINSTLSGNAVIGEEGIGGGISTSNTLTLQNCTLSGNSAAEGGGISDVFGTVTLRNTIFQQGASGANLFISPEFGGTITSEGHNLSSDDGGGFLTATGDLVNTDPLLGALANNGGPTATHALLPGSPAIDAGDDAVLGAPYNLTTDQRGSPRKLGAHVDIGAYEYDVAQSDATLVVNTTSEHDDGLCGALDCTLLEAVNAANAASDASTIVFQAGLGGTILNTLSSGGISLLNPVTIVGPGARVLTVSGNNANRIFNVATGVIATISGLTLSNGYSVGVGSGGAIFSNGTLTLQDCALLGNQGGSGGAVASAGSLTIVGCTLAGNTSTGHGAAVRNSGILEITNSTLQGNTAASSGAISSIGSSTSIATTTVTSCTISGNSATTGGFGGGLFNGSFSTCDVGNTIVAGNSAATGPDVSGTFYSLGYNLIGNSDASVGFTATGDLTGNSNGPLDPVLGPLQNNGGPTDTRALLSGSPAIDAGSGFGLATDQRGFARPYDDADVANVDDGSDIGAFERQPLLTISDVTVIEGNSGATINAIFTVSLSQALSQTVTVDYTTANGSAVAPGDYTAMSGTLSFAPGKTSKTIQVTVNGDVLDEANETFLVNLTNAVNATIADDQGQGAVTDNDPTPTLSIGDATVTEGAGGTTSIATFAVTLSAASGKTVTVNYATANGTANSVNDYITKSGSFTFQPGKTSKTVTVAIYGDNKDEADETFKVNLSGAVNATLADGQGIGTILDDDPTPTLSISDVTITEGAAGTSTTAIFTVSLSAVSGKTVTVDYATGDDTATAGSDYTAKSGTLTFTPGKTSKKAKITVTGDGVDEADETFFVDLSNAINASIADGQGLGTITDDDGPAAPSE